MPIVRTAKHLLLESTTKSVESGTNDVICQFCTVKGMVVESEVLKAQNCALSKFSLPVHCNEKFGYSVKGHMGTLVFEPLPPFQSNGLLVSSSIICGRKITRNYLVSFQEVEIFEVKFLLVFK